MAYDMTFKTHLRKDRDDQAKAWALDAAYKTFSAPEQAFVDRLIMIGYTKLGLGPMGAKAFAANFILFFHMNPQDQEDWIMHGTAIRAAYEWACAKRTGKDVSELDEEMGVPK